ncbi:MAG: alpha/beta hydrolase [Oscillospiraceae bacterium]
MAKVLKKILIAIAVIVGVLLLVLVGLMIISHFDSLKPHLSDDYYTEFKSDFALEKKYVGLGSFEVANADFDATDKKIDKYRIWYPKELESKQQEYPLIVITNASNVAALNYEPYFKRLASWGFIVVGNEDRQAGSGESTSLTLDYVLKLNDKSDSIFYKNISQTNIGIIGFSQGGAGAIRAATEFDNSNRYKTIFTGSAAYPFLAKNMGWEYDASKIAIPYFMVAGTGKSDDAGVENIYEKFGGVCPLEALKDTYGAMSNDVFKVRARIKGAEHEDMFTLTDGYMTAWMCWQLQGDTEAEKVFTGDNAEIMQNTKWQDKAANIYLG